jgi:hypothetical protein
MGDIVGIALRALSLLKTVIQFDPALQINCCCSVQEPGYLWQVGPRCKCAEVGNFKWLIPTKIGMESGFSGQTVAVAGRLL